MNGVSLSVNRLRQLVDPVLAHHHGLLYKLVIKPERFHVDNVREEEVVQNNGLVLPSPLRVAQLRDDVDDEDALVFPFLALDVECPQIRVHLQELRCTLCAIHVDRVILIIVAKRDLLEAELKLILRFANAVPLDGQRGVH